MVDGSGFIFRAYHALPPLTRKSDGLPIGAVAGFSNMVWKMLQETKGTDAPTHVAVIFDKSEHTFRNELYSDYKQNRPPLRGRRHHRDLRDPGGRSRRPGDDRLGRQGSDAARRAGHRHVRHLEEQGDRAGRGLREVRGRAGPGDRRAGARRRFDRPARRG
jgi:5'-3' exonuclease